MDNLQQTPSGLFIPASVADDTDATARAALDKQFTGMQKMEKFFPQLVKLAIDVAQRLTALAKRHGLGPESVLMDTPRWHPNGNVQVRIGLDPEATRITTTDRAAKNFTNLQELNKVMPQAVDLVMAIAFQLVPAVNAKKLRPEAILFSKPQINEAETEFVFSVGMPRPEVDL